MLFKFILNCDLYANRIHFLLHHKETLNTFFSGVVSFVIMVLTLIFSVFIIIDLCSQKNKNLRIINNFNVYSQNFQINNQNFPFAFYFTINNETENFNFSNYFTIKIKTEYTQFENEIAYRHCEFTGDDKIFSSLQNEQLYCPRNYTSDIDNLKNYYLNITVSKCEDCEFKEEIENMLINNIITFHFTYITSFFNFEEENSINDYISQIITENFTLNQNNGIFAYFYLTPMQIEKDKNIITNKKYYNNSFAVSQDLFIKDESENNFSIIIKPSNSKSILTIIRFKLGDALSLIGGFAYFAYLIGFIITYQIEKNRKNVSLLNSVFDFSNYNKRAKNEDKPLQNSILLLNNNSKRKDAENKSDLQISDICPSIKGEFRLDEIKPQNPNKQIDKSEIDLKIKKLLIIKQKNSNSMNKLLKFSFIEVLHLHCCCELTNTFRSKKRLYIAKLFEMRNLLSIAKYFDLSIVIEKITNVLLSKGQKATLSLLSRELVSQILNQNKTDYVADALRFEQEISKYTNKLKKPTYPITQIDKRIIKIVDTINI